MAEVMGNPEKWRVLLVDDVMDNLMVASSILEFHGVEFETAKNGLDALNVLKSFDANLILLDLSMPTMDGWELIRKLTSDQRYQSITVIAVTAHASKTDKARVLKAGFAGYISKPYDATNFLKNILEIISTKVKKQ